MPGGGSEPPAEPDQGGPVRNLTAIGWFLIPLAIGLVVALT